MRFFKYIAAASMASAAIRLRRDDGDSFEVTGEETEEELDALLTDFGGENPFGRLDGGRGELEEMLNPRKFRQWKLMIKYLQPSPKKWRDFQNYGCHCIPEGSRKIGQAGYGEPVDAVDASCRSFHQCYRCLSDEHSDEEEGCNGEDVRYKFKGSNVNGVKTVQCTDPVGSCRYNVCQCDLALAQKLQTAVLVWDVKYHQKQGDFDRAGNCHKSGGGNNFEECCGDKFTFPNNMIRRSNQCCVGTEAKPLSSGMC